MTDYPIDRKNCGYAIRFIKALLNSDAIREHGEDAILLTIFVASREDRLHYAKAPMFWREELMDRFGKGSVNAFLRMRKSAIQAGLICHIEGTRVKPGMYWTLIPDWLRPQFEAFRKRNGSTSKRSASGAPNGAPNGALSIPSTQDPVQEKRKRFVRPSLDEVTAYWLAESLDGDPGAFHDYYESNGWRVGKAGMKDWRATARNWSRRQNSFHKSEAKPKPKEVETEPNHVRNKRLLDERRAREAADSKGLAS